MRTRFAPSPTGPLHLGHVAAMIFVWGLADRERATVDVRIEDHDRQRCRPEYTDRLIADLEWLGFVPARGGNWSRQSSHCDRYELALSALRDRGLIYACECSRRMLGTARDGLEPCYAGTCRDSRLRESPTTSLRIRLPDDRIRFLDERHGVQEQQPASQCGDFVIRDRHGHWTYQFAVTVDDLTDGIDWIIRGDDLLPSTGRQLLLRRLLGNHATPRWFHHPLILDANGRKLSKSEAAPPLEDLRQAGFKAAQVIGLAAWRVGLVREGGAIEAAEVGEWVGRELTPLRSPGEVT